MDSTNNWALRNCGKKVFNYPLLILTDQQTAGRGRGSNQWSAQTGSLTFSLVVDLEGENLQGETRNLLSTAIALAICKTIQTIFNLECKLKWPNDVIIDDRKVAGILIETVQRDQLPLAIIGVGVNCYNQLPPTLRPKAVALAELAPHVDMNQASVTDFLVGLVGEMRFAIRSLANNPTMIVQQANAKSWLVGKRIQVEHAHEIVEGCVIGLDERGGLVIDVDAKARTCASLPDSTHGAGSNRKTIYSGHILAVGQV
ncbi:MAG TPA: biotin--[acetyl-CoA-carboxylase] ligase [Pirellulaceae bacterium]|nr:biotin--[acetyl-CoA-carboxylase] ligase [Pirellulaceae bacterium]HMO91789.1 biotin--[acetyl-CoA-carboxylase] ligase [Pirellulaceae bacterium]HMP69588.1 biotin--[acetyl-CoA-carboxylase] ligase [Pirellulaceae bacterium]